MTALGLPFSIFERLRRLVLLSAALHDLGKASSHFQKLVRDGKTVQLVRHEAVSAWLGWSEPLRSWLRSLLADPDDLPLVLAAAAGHHRKFPAEAVNDGHALGFQMHVWSGHRDVSRLLRLIAKLTNASTCPPTLQDVTLPLPKLAYDENRKLFRDLEAALEQRLQQDSATSKLLALCKAMVIDADVAGSALSLSDGSQWIARMLTDRPDRQAVERVVTRRLGSSSLRTFQEQVAACTSPLLLLQAGCGAGKTVAAYAWFARQHVGRQLWITYPTTGTALEGFRDYLDGFDDLVGHLESGRREIDLELMGVTDRLDERSNLRGSDRIASLRAWGKHAVACTVDTVLGLMQNQRKGLYAWAALADSAVVFDEIHSYDNRLFGTLLQFLDHLPGIPVLLMTASLPAARLEALQRVAQRRTGRELVIVPGDRTLEELPRYRLVWDHVEPSVTQAVYNGQKVLWVSNTVDRCLGAAAWAESLGCRPLIYHSRFRYEDRVARHADIIRAFNGPGPCVAVTTQVAEMSLDLSADLLITDLAPVPAVIQRLGRLNRYLQADAPGPVRLACVRPVENASPYQNWDPASSAEWVNALLEKGDCSQADLIDAWKPEVSQIHSVGSAWLDGGLDTQPKPLRQDSPGITVIRSEDLAAYRKQPQRAALPMLPPSGNDWRSWPRLQHLLIAPTESIEYDPMRGAKWIR